MSAMLAAIQKRKAGGQNQLGDHQDMTHHSQHSDDADQNKLHSFVSGLSDDQKNKLQMILEKSGHDEQKIAQGHPSSEERGKIAEQMSLEGGAPEIEAQEPDDESDEIGKSMLDSKFTGGNPPTKPRNLGERVKMAISSKLKAKGKL